jgi:gamma-glutamyltranspeptidase/glutathione hydrolase
VSLYVKSIVASGHQLVSDAAATILEAGGNAFDAVVAAGFASAVVEPALTSLGGGGLLVGYSEEHGQELYFDFFVDTPGRGLDAYPAKPHFFAVTVDFSSTSQDFNIGLGSVAVPGTLKGLLHIQRRLGKMDLQEVLTPAKQYALGHELNDQQAHFLHLLRPIMTLTPRGREIYEPSGQYLHSGDVLHNHQLANFFDQLICEGDENFYRGEIAGRIAKEMREGNGLLTAEDLQSYEVQERSPLKIPYRGHSFLTAAEPSMGGTLIGLSLSLLARQAKAEAWGTGEHLQQTVGLMREVERLREAGLRTPSDLQLFLADSTGICSAGERLRQFSRGTTHISVADRFGNCASMTCSNGEGSGYFAPDTGVMFNNMMGEDDLHPDGFHKDPPGLRVGSMMSPSLLLHDGKVRLVIGSGGSKRIRIAISQVLTQVVDFDRSLADAVAAPRLYLDEDTLQVEPGFSPAAVAAVGKAAAINVWQHQNVYFGGVHAVIPGLAGAGDKRRGGSVRTVTHQ